MTRRQYNLHNFPLYCGQGALQRHRRWAIPLPSLQPRVLHARAWARARAKYFARGTQSAVWRRSAVRTRWAEARVKITRMTLTIKLDRNWSSFQLANSAPPLSVTDSAIAPSARMHNQCGARTHTNTCDNIVFVSTLCAHTQIRLNNGAVVVAWCARTHTLD